MVTRGQSWSFVVTRGHSWSFVVIRGHSWSLVVTRGHSWSLVVTRGHSWSLVVTRGHSWSLVCTFRQDHKCCYGEAPDQLCQNIITKKDNNLRGSEKLVIPRPETNFLHKTVTFRGAVLWNKLPTNLKNEERHNNFKMLILRQWILALTQTIMILTISIFKLF